MEEFGADLEEFGAAPAAAEQPTDREELIAMLEDLQKQIAATMDDLERQRLKTAEAAVYAQISNKSKAQWLDMSKAYGEFYGEPKAFANKLKNLGGMSDLAFETLREELSKAHAEKEAKSGKKAPAKKGADKKTTKDAPPPVAPDERFAAVVKHAQNLGLDAQVLFDELGYSVVDDVSVAGTLAEINKRAQANATTDGAVQVSGGDDTALDEFGAGTNDDTVAPPAAPAEHPAAANGDDVWVLIKTADGRELDPETGEIVDRNWVLKLLGWSDFPTEYTKEHVEDILRVRNFMWANPAKVYREQAEKLAAPLEKRAAAWDKMFGPYLDKVGDALLPRSGPKSKEPGKLTAKTLHFMHGSISWTKEGGRYIEQHRMFGWLAEQKTKLMELREQGTPEALEEIQGLEKRFGVRLKTEVDYNKELILQSDLPFVQETAVNEFAKREIK